MVLYFMSAGFIYIASNTALKDGLLKIGLTKSRPESRLDSLSKSTSIPDYFHLEYSKKVSDVNAAEIRMHMLLEKFRHRKEKEFFAVNLNSAIQLIEWISNYLDKHEYNSKYIDLHDELIEGRYDRKITLNEDKLIDSTIAFSIDQNKLHQIFGYSGHIVSGFSSAKALSEIFKVKEKSMMLTMRRFCKSCGNLRPITKSGNEVNIFERLYYHKGHMAWKHGHYFRPLYENNKI